MGIVTVTGHRDLTSPAHDPENSDTWLTRAIASEIRTERFNGHHICRFGGAQGFDIVAAEHAIRAGKEGRGPIDVVAYLPYFNFTDGWDKRQVDRLNKILNQCIDIVYSVPRKLENYEDRRNAYLIRNERMLTDSPGASRVIAAWNGEGKGGTYYTINKAVELSIPITIIDIVNFKIIKA